MSSTRRRRVGLAVAVLAAVLTWAWRLWALTGDTNTSQVVNGQTQGMNADFQSTFGIPPVLSPPTAGSISGSVSTDYYKSFLFGSGSSPQIWTASLVTVPASTGTFTITASQITCEPFFVPRPGADSTNPPSLDRLKAVVTTATGAGGGGVCRFAVYRSNGIINFRPSVLVYQDSSSISTELASMSTCSAGPAVPCAIQSGAIAANLNLGTLYWACVTCNAGTVVPTVPTFRAFPAASGWPWGGQVDTVGAPTGMNLLTPVNLYTFSSTFPTIPPTMSSSSGTFSTTTFMPAWFFRMTN